jgi:formylglycine-generating enzyme required for sulfatase activity
MRALIPSLLFLAVPLFAQQPGFDPHGLGARRVLIGGMGPFGDWRPSPYAGMAAIPAGTYEMGRHTGTGYADELPVHAVVLDAFYMDVYEVTNADYASYLNTAYAQGRIRVSAGVVYQVGGAGKALCDTTVYCCSRSRITWNGSRFGVTPGKEEHPMIEVSWYGACAYANHRSRQDWLMPCYDETTWDCSFGVNGYRLPTEAEWEYAARGGQHGPYTLYPWGDTIDGSQANYYSSGDPYEGAFPETTPVDYYDGGQTPPGVDMANGYGLYGMPDNVYEWCWDWYDDTYYSWSPTDNPTGPASGWDRVCRGGGWCDGMPQLRSAYRRSAEPRNGYEERGFRLVADRR